MFSASQLSCREAAHHARGLDLWTTRKAGREPHDLVENSRVLRGSWGLHRGKVMGKKSLENS